MINTNNQQKQKIIHQTKQTYKAEINENEKQTTRHTKNTKKKNK